jgi:hypothetical protein
MGCVDGEDSTGLLDAQHLQQEIAAARRVLQRLIMEEDDLKVLVPGVARLVGVTVQAVRAQQTIGSREEDDWLDGADVGWERAGAQGETTDGNTG